MWGVCVCVGGGVVGFTLICAQVMIHVVIIHKYDQYDYNKAASSDRYSSAFKMSDNTCTLPCTLRSRSAFNDGDYDTHQVHD